MIELFKKTFFFKICIIVAVLFAMLFLNRNIFRQSEYPDNIENKGRQVQTSALEDDLLESTNLGNNNLSADKRDKLVRLNQKLDKKRFLGAFLGVKNDHLLFSSENGYANETVRSPFRLDSILLVGDYQTLINNVAILELVDKKKIDLSDKLSKYVKNVSNSNSVSIKDLLLNRVSYYARKSQRVSIVNAKKLDSKNKLLKQKPYSETGYFKANELLKIELLSSAMNQTYKRAIKVLIFNPLRLNNSSVASSTSTTANSVKSYEYSTSKGIPVQKKELTIKGEGWGQYSMFMSLSDITLSLNRILNANDFSEKYTNIFFASLNNMSDVKVLKSYFILKSRAEGQYLTVKADKNGSKVAISISNFPNRKITVDRVVENAYNILN